MNYTKKLRIYNNLNLFCVVYVHVAPSIHQCPREIRLVHPFSIHLSTKDVLAFMTVTRMSSFIQCFFGQDY